MILVKMKIRTVAPILLVVLSLSIWAQTSPQQSSSQKSKNLDELGLQVQDSQQRQTTAGEGAHAAEATPEKTISSQEAKELFKSVDEILKFASQETKLPIKEVVKRKLVER